jgi:hypothetical protein
MFVKTNLVIGWEECRWQCPLLESKQHRRLQMLLARYLMRDVKTMVLPSLPKISVPIFQVQIMLANVCTRDSMMKLLPLDHSSLRSINICILTNPTHTHTHTHTPRLPQRLPNHPFVQSGKFYRLFIDIFSSSPNKRVSLKDKPHFLSRLVKLLRIKGRKMHIISSHLKCFELNHTKVYIQFV